MKALSQGVDQSFSVYTHTFVTKDPARKNTARRAVKTLHGCRQWMTAVMKAVNNPRGVKEFFDHARNTRPKTRGTAK